MYVVLVEDLKLGGVTVYGPYQKLVKAQTTKHLMLTTDSVEYFDPEEYIVSVAKLRKYGQ